jgi:hypothetical protein
MNTTASAPPRKIYVLDTNVLIGLSLWLPISLNGAFWERLGESLENGDWVLLDAVVGEIKYNQDLIKWCKDQQKKGLVSIVTDDHKNRGVEINNLYKMIDDVTQKSTVDTYLVAYAEEKGFAVFSRESPRENSTKLYKIPDVCTILKIQRINKPEKFMQEIGYTNN